MKTLIRIFLLLICFPLIIGSCGVQEADNSKPAFEAGSLPVTGSKGIKPNVTDPENESKFISARGYIDVPPENRASVSPYYGGYVMEVKVLPGQSVKKGEVIFTLQSPKYLEIQQSYLEAKGQLEFLSNNYERQKTLYSENIASEKAFKKAQSEYRVMQARATGLREQIILMGLSIKSLEAGNMVNTLLFRAPIDGSVTHVNITRSAYVDAGEIAAEIVNMGHIHLELDVFEKDLLRLKVGQAISFRIPESGDREYKGEVHLIGHSVDPKKRTVLVHGHIEDESMRFVPGMYVEARIREE